MSLTIEVEQEEDGRWLAEVVELAGVLVYGQSRAEAIARAQALSLRVLADRLEHGERVLQGGGFFAIPLKRTRRWKGWTEWRDLLPLERGIVPRTPGAYVIATNQPIQRAVSVDSDGILHI